MNPFWKSIGSAKRYQLAMACLLTLICPASATDPPAAAVLDQPQTVSPQAAPKRLASPPPAIVIDILRLRKELGNPLTGSLLENPVVVPTTPSREDPASPGGSEPGPEKSFVQALHEVRQQALSAGREPGTAKANSATAAHPVVFSRFSPGPSPLQQSLRQSWLLLDQRAVELEDLRCYDEADGLRKLSQQIRLQSRQLSTKRSAPRPQDHR